MKFRKMMFKKNERYLFILPWDIKIVGGVNQVIKNLYTGVKNDGKYEPVVLVNRWKDRNVSQEIYENMIVHYLRLCEPTLDRSIFSLRSIKNMFLINENKYRLLVYLIKNKIKIVNIHFPGLFINQFSYIKRKKIYDFKLIISFHGSDVIKIETKKKYRDCIINSLRYVDSIIVPSKNLGDKIKRFVPELSQKIHTVYNGIDVNYFKNIADLNVKKYTSKKIKTILHVGSFQKVKAQDILIKAWKLLANKYCNYILLLIGANGDFLQTLETLIDDLKLNEKIQIITDASHGNVAAAMHQASMIVLPSLSEGGVPLVLLEAGVFKKPIIATNVGGITELIENKRNGILVNPKDIYGLSRSIETLINNEKLGKFIGQNIYDHVCSKYSWEKTIKEYLKIVNDACKSS